MKYYELKVGLFHGEVSHSSRTWLLKNQASKQPFFYHEYAGNLPVMWSCGTKPLGLSSGKNGLFVCTMGWDFTRVAFILEKKSGEQRRGSQ